LAVTNAMNIVNGMINVSALGFMLSPLRKGWSRDTGSIGTTQESGWGERRLNSRSIFSRLLMSRQTIADEHWNAASRRYPAEHFAWILLEPLRPAAYKPERPCDC